MYQFRKKFRRSNDFFYNNVERKGNTQKDDANSSVSYESQFFEQENEFGDLDSEDIFTKQSISIITEEAKQPCQLSQSRLSPTGHYTGLLLQFDFASNVSRQQSFVVHDYNANKRTIMHNSFVFVHQYPHLLLDGYGWILCCSCDANRKQFVEALPNNMQLDPQKDILYPSCIHILAMEKYLVVYDRKFGIEAKDFIEKKSTSMIQSVFSDHLYHEMQPEEDLFSAVCRVVQWIAVKPVNSPWGVCTFVYSKVTPPQPELKCCSTSSYHCIHVTTLAKAMQIVEEDEMDSPLALFKCSFGITPEMRDYFELATLSKEKVSLFETGNENDASDFTDLPEKNGHKILAPSESGICSCGAEWDKRSIQDEWLYIDLCSVAYFYSIHDVKVYCRPCSSCAMKKHYDGIENRIVWFGSYSISHAVLKDYIRLFITSSLPMYKYYVAYVQRQVSSGNFNFPKEITYAKFRLAIIAMIRLLDIDFDNGFFCELCGRIPKKVVMDGTTLGIQKTFLPNNLRESDTGLLDGSRFEMRNFINRRNVRALLKKYSDSKLSWDEFQELKSEISSKGLRTLLEWLEKQGFITSCPNSCRRLLAALASDKPVCAIVPKKKF